MNNIPLVTVAVPVYNAERFLPSGLDSLWNQTYQNFEILLADDGSTDATPSLCDEIAAKDGRVRVLHCQHQGVGAMRNALVENARGDYLYFFDIDDWTERGLLERCVSVMEEGGYDMIFFGFEVENRPSNQREQVRLPHRVVQTNDEFRDFYCNELAGMAYGCGYLHSKFFRISFLRPLFEGGNRFEHIPMHEDEIFLLGLFSYVERTCSLPEVFYHYIIYPKGNASTSFRRDGVDNTVRLYRKRMELYRTWIGDSPEVLKIYREQLLVAASYGLMKPQYYSHSGMNAVQHYRYIAETLALPEVRECAAHCRIPLADSPKSIFAKLMDGAFYADRPLVFYAVRCLRDFYKKHKR
ncbi:MAG: glycosyltransferase family 2 protein [Bacteroidales bacterium]|nr:glycosyltransferase family 2 protein [Bacteroidales bacterium]